MQAAEAAAVPLTLEVVVQAAPHLAKLIPYAGWGAAIGGAVGYLATIEPLKRPEIPPGSQVNSVDRAEMPAMADPAGATASGASHSGGEQAGSTAAGSTQSPSNPESDSTADGTRGDSTSESAEGTHEESQRRTAQAPDDSKVDSQAVPRKSNRQIRKEWEKANGKPWPKDAANGRNQDVSHKKARADGGTDALDNVEPKPHAEHIQQHQDNGDFKRWGARSKKAEGQ